MSQTQNSSSNIHSVCAQKFTNKRSKPCCRACELLVKWHNTDLRLVQERQCQLSSPNPAAAATARGGTRSELRTLCNTQVMSYNTVTASGTGYCHHLPPLLNLPQDCRSAPTCTVCIMHHAHGLGPACGAACQRHICVGHSVYKWCMTLLW